MNIQDISGFNNEVFLLDTNIISYLDNKYASKTIGSFLAELSKNNKLAVSDFTLFELIRGSGSNQEIQLESLIKIFERYPIGEEVLRVAARLDGMYKDDDVDKVSKIDTGDFLIAATSVLISSKLVTANGKHFPRNFFDEIYRCNVNYRDDLIAVYILSPNIDFITKKFENRKK